MPRDPKPWFRKDRDAWFVTINGRRYNLGPDRNAAHDRFHELMLSGGECVLGTPKLDNIGLSLFTNGVLRQAPSVISLTALFTARNGSQYSRPLRRTTSSSCWRLMQPLQFWRAEKCAS